MAKLICKWRGAALIRGCGIRTFCCRQNILNCLLEFESASQSA